MKVTGNIVQLKVTGSMSQLKVVGTISQLEVSGSIVEGGATPPAPPAYCDEAIALFARMDIQASDAQKVLMNTLIVSMKASGVWDKLNVFYNFAQETTQAALLNWKSTSYNATAVNSPTFTALEGFTGDTGRYITSNYNVLNDKINASLNNTSIGVYLRLGTAETQSYNIGSIYIGDLRIAKNGTTMYFRLYQGNSNSATTSEIGFFILSRSGANIFEVFKNKTRIVNSTEVSTSIPDSVLLFLREYVYSSTQQISLGYLSSSLTQTNVNNLTDAFETYMDANGKGII